MPWPQWWSSTKKDDTPEKGAGERVKDTIDAALETGKSETVSIASKAASSKLSAFTQPQTLIATTVLTAGCLGLFRFYRSYLRRFPEAINIKPSFFRKRSIVGKVTSVGDGDNFRIFHTPGGRLAGWGWLRKIPDNAKDLRHRTIHIRLAGVDAPEMAHFGRPAQPYGKEALDWLNDYLLGRRIRAYVHKPDQYSRVVATTYVWKGLFRRDVGLQMLRAGMATVYEAKTGVEFGEGLEQKYRSAEWWAKTKRRGMWASKKKDFESPREYKNRYQNDSGNKASE